MLATLFYEILDITLYKVRCEMHISIYAKPYIKIYSDYQRVYNKTSKEKTIFGFRVGLH